MTSRDEQITRADLTREQIVDISRRRFNITADEFQSICDMAIRALSPADLVAALPKDEPVAGYCMVPAPKGMREPLKVIGNRLRQQIRDRFFCAAPVTFTDNERQVLLSALNTLNYALADDCEVRSFSVPQPDHGNGGHYSTCETVKPESQQGIATRHPKDQASGYTAPAALAEKEDGGLMYPPSIRCQQTIGQMLSNAMGQCVANGANSVSMPDEYVEVAAWLQGVTVNKPLPPLPERKVRDEARL